MFIKVCERKNRRLPPLQRTERFSFSSSQRCDLLYSYIYTYTWTSVRAWYSQVSCLCFCYLYTYWYAELYISFIDCLLLVPLAVYSNSTSELPRLQTRTVPFGSWSSIINSSWGKPKKMASLSCIYLVNLFIYSLINASIYLSICPRECAKWRACTNFFSL